jgi:aspartate aminotransferase
MALFANIPKSTVDPMNILKHKADRDTTPGKVDLGVGVYRDENGNYYEFPSIRKVCIASTSDFQDTSCQG